MSGQNSPNKSDDLQSTDDASRSNPVRRRQAATENTSLPSLPSQQLPPMSPNLVLDGQSFNFNYGFGAFVPPAAPVRDILLPRCPPRFLDNLPSNVGLIHQNPESSGQTVDQPPTLTLGPPPDMRPRPSTQPSDLMTLSLPIPEPEGTQFPAQQLGVPRATPQPVRPGLGKRPRNLHVVGGPMEPYTCGICGSAFTALNTLFDHMRSYPSHFTWTNLGHEGHDEGFGSSSAITDWSDPLPDRKRPRPPSQSPPPPRPPPPPSSPPPPTPPPPPSPPPPAAC